MKTKTLISNKVVLYLSSRYLTYFLQFVTSLVMAAKLGPFYFGIWSFILLLLQYFQHCHFGIYNSLNVLYVQNREDHRKCNDYVVNSLVLECYLSIIVVLLYLAYKQFGTGIFDKYHADGYIVWICIIAILQYYSGLAINVFRVKNQLRYVAFCQSVIVVLNFFCIFIFTREALIVSLVTGYLVGNLLAVGLLCATKAFNLKEANITRLYQYEILKKGILLFLYNTCFYFIVLSIRTIISYKYSVEEFGTFTFSFSLSHAIMLLLESLSFIVFPKIIGKFSGDDKKGIRESIRVYRTAYVTLSHGLIYLALVFFPLVELVFPRYEDALTSMNLIGLTILMNTCGCGYTEYLISQNQEKRLSLISLMALAVNCVVGVLLAFVFEVEYFYVIIGSMVAYLAFTFCISLSARKKLEIESNIFTMFFPFRLFLPYSVALIISVTKSECLIMLPLVLFFLMNWRECANVANMVKLILKKPEIVNL